MRLCVFTETELEVLPIWAPWKEQDSSAYFSMVQLWRNYFTGIVCHKQNNRSFLTWLYSWLWYSVYKISFRTKNMSQLARWFQRENSILEFLKKSSDIHTRRITWLLVFTQELTVFTPVDVVLFRRVNSLQVDVSYLLSLPSAFGKWYVTGGLVLRSLPIFYPWLHGDLWMKLRNWTVVQLCSFHN